MNFMNFEIFNRVGSGLLLLHTEFETEPLATKCNFIEVVFEILSRNNTPSQYPRISKLSPRGPRVFFHIMVHQFLSIKTAAIYHLQSIKISDRILLISKI